MPLHGHQALYSLRVSFPGTISLVLSTPVTRTLTPGGTSWGSTRLPMVHTMAFCFVSTAKGPERTSRAKSKAACLSGPIGRRYLPAETGALHFVMPTRELSGLLKTVLGTLVIHWKARLISPLYGHKLDSPVPNGDRA